mgnify:CR=1 FL=1
MAIDLGDIPTGTPPTAGEKLQIRSAIGVGQTDAPTFLAQTLTGQSLTGTQATSLVDLSATWNTDGNPSLIYGRVTNTKSGATANLIDLGTFAGGSLFRVDKAGNFGSTLNAFCVGYGAFTQPGLGNFQFNSSNFISTNHLVVSNLYVGATDVALVKDAPGILAQRNGTAKQVHRVYNTFLGTTANEWGGFDWLTTTNTLRIGTEHGGTGTARPIDFVTGGVVRMSIGVAAGAIDANLSIGTGDRFRSGPEGISVFAASGIGGGSGDFRVSLAAAVGVRVTAGLLYAFNSATTMFSGGLDTALGRNAAGVVEINNATAGVFRDLRVRSVIQQPPATITPASNGDLVVEATSNTLLTFKFKGSDGTVRSGTMVVA